MPAFGRSTAIAPNMSGRPATRATATLEHGRIRHHHAERGRADEDGGPIDERGGREPEQRPPGDTEVRRAAGDPARGERSRGRPVHAVPGIVPDIVEGIPGRAEADGRYGRQQQHGGRREGSERDPASRQHSRRGHHEIGRANQPEEVRHESTSWYRRSYRGTTRSAANSSARRAAAPRNRVCSALSRNTSIARPVMAAMT